jgi:hypothetical protein
VIEGAHQSASLTGDCAAAAPVCQSELTNATELWRLLYAIVEALKITPDQNLRSIAKEIIYMLEVDGLPRLTRLAQIICLYESGSNAPAVLPN